MRTSSCLGLPLGRALHSTAPPVASDEPAPCGCMEHALLYTLASMPVAEVWQRHTVPLKNGAPILPGILPRAGGSLAAARRRIHSHILFWPFAARQRRGRVAGTKDSFEPSDGWPSHLDGLHRKAAAPVSP